MTTVRMDEAYDDFEKELDSLGQPASQMRETSVMEMNKCQLDYDAVHFPQNRKGSVRLCGPKGGA